MYISETLKRIGMVTIKSFTSLEQSKMLAEILPIDSADMYWYLATKGNPKAMFNERYNEYGDFELPCWSLAALLDVLPKIVSNESLFVETSTALWHIGYRNVYIARADNPVDACVAMIEKLNELKML